MIEDHRITPSSGYIAVPTLPDLLVRASVEHADSPALTIGAASLTYGELRERVVDAARGLSALGVQRGDRVAIFLPNCIEFVVFVFAAASVGAVSIPINSRLQLRELTHIQRDAAPRVIVTTARAQTDHFERVQRMVASLAADDPHPVIIACHGCSGYRIVGDEDFAVAVASTGVDVVEAARARIRLRDPAVILYTSGTTAMPKGCLHTHEALVRNGIVTGHSRFLLRSDDCFLDPLPMFHVSFLTPLIACMDAGAHMLTMARFEPVEALDIIERQKVTWLFAAFPAIYDAILGVSTFASRDTTTVRMTMGVGHTAQLRRLQSAFPAAQLLSTYGSTETAGVITYHEPTATDEQRVTTCGTPFRGIELAIAPVTAGDAAHGDRVGEILVRGYSVLDEYINDVSATAEAVDPDGWLHTGDLGALDGDGHLRFLGRLKDVVKVGGENVSAAEVEAAIAEHPDVVAVAVVAAPDDRLDEVIAAFVERRPGAALTEQLVVDFCRGQIATYKLPRYVRFVEEWPMSGTKILKGELRDRIATELCQR